MPFEEEEENEEETPEDGRLEESEYYLHVESGDLYVINWIQNRPDPEKGWVKISRKVYNAVYNGMSITY